MYLIKNSRYIQATYISYYREYILTHDTDSLFYFCKNNIYIIYVSIVRLIITNKTKILLYLIEKKNYNILS